MYQPPHLLARLRGLLEVNRPDGPGDLSGLLAVAAEAVAEALGFGTVVVNLYRPSWDDFEVAVVHGSDEARAELLGDTSDWRFWGPLLDERFNRCGAYLIREGQLDWSTIPGRTYIPVVPEAKGPDDWHAEDALVVPLRAADGGLLGILSVDEPRLGNRPTDRELETLVAVAAHAAQAIENGIAAAETERDRRSLEQLLQVSSRLAERRSANDVLQVVCDGIRSALGFQLVVVELADRDADRFVPVASAGFDLDHASLQLDATVGDLCRVFDPSFEIEGCYLLEREQALARVGAEPSTFKSSLNGRGERAWNRHWLIVPFNDPNGDVMGFIWADDPEDRLIPSRRRLQALRLFANQTKTALDSARQVGELQAANERQRAIIEASPVGIFVLDDQRTVRSWNPAAQRMFGFSESEVLGREPRWIPERDLEAFRRSFDLQIASGSVVQAAYTDIRADGSEIEVSASSAPLRDADGNVTGVLSIMADLSDRARAERELAKHNAELRALHETGLDLLDQRDATEVLETILERAAALLDSRDGYICLVDPETKALAMRVAVGLFEDFAGVEHAAGECVAGTVWERGSAITVDDYAVWDRRLEALVDAGCGSVAAVPLAFGSAVVGVLAVAYRDEHRFEPAELSLLDRFGQLASLALENARLYEAAQRELDERRQAEEALREVSEAREALIVASPIAIMALDREGAVRSWNPAAEQMFGWPAAEAIGRRPPFVGDEHLGEFNALLNRTLEGGTLTEREATRTRRDGSRIDISISAAPLRNASGEIVGIMSAVADLTSRKRAEEDLARRNAELEALHATTLDLIERLDGGNVLETIVERAGELLGTPHGYLYLVDRDAGDLRVAVGLGIFDGHVGARLERGQGLAGRVWAEGRAAWVDDYDTWEGGVERYTDAGFHAVAGVPLRSGSEIVGVLGIAYSSALRTFGEAELALLARFGQLASLALENSRLYADAQHELEERRVAEEALRKSQELYRAIVDNSTDIFALIGLSGETLYVSPAHKRLLGYEPDEVIGRPAIELVHPDDAEGVSGVLAATFRGETPEPSNVRRLRHKDGHWILMEGVVSMVEDEHGRPEMVLAIARDVTEQHRQQEFLAKTQELYRTVVDNSRDLILLLDLDGSVQFSSPSGRAILGYDRDELVGVSSFDLLHPDDVDPVRSFVVESLRSGSPGAYVARVRHKDGSWIEMEGIPAPVLENGEMVAILGVARDVSERRRAEEEHAALAEQLRQSQKMEAIGQLAGGIAHDFNNLLTAITGYGDLALGRLDADSPVRRNVEEMKRAGDRAAVLTRQLLAFSRKQVLQPKVLDLNGVVSDLESMLGRVLGEHVEFVTALDADLGHTRADPGQVEQVVMNLAINARDAMPTGGKLTLSTANVELDELFVARHHGAVAGQYVMLAVSDTGVGMDRDTLERVFDPFFTTKPQGQGTGLGLSTVYGIVKQTGGQIWAYAEPGQGATFKVYLPRVWERAAERTERAAPPRLVGTETVLLVEDEAIVRDLVREMLETGGYRVLEAPAGADAIALAAGYEEPIDLLVTDVVMPAMSGQELATRLLAERPELRVLFTSGYTEDAITSHGVLAPGTAFVEKPFTAAELGQRVRDLLDRRPEADLREAV